MCSVGYKERKIGQLLVNELAVVAIAPFVAVFRYEFIPLFETLAHGNGTSAYGEQYRLID